MRKLYGALLMLSLIWGTSFLFIKVLLQEMSPIAVVFGRCLFGTIMLLLISFIRKDRLLNKNLPWGFIFIVALINNLFPWLLISSSETSISSSLASILNATTPIWTLIIGFLFFSTTLRRNQWFGIFIGFIGIYLLSNFKIGEINSGHIIGVVLMSAAAICYGMAAQMTKKYLKDITIMQISFFTLFFSSIVSFVLLLIMSPQSISAYFQVINIIPLLGLGALGSGVAYLLYFYLVTKGSPEFASIVTYLAPVSAIMWGTLLLKEKIHPSMLFGLLVIFLGVYITTYKSKKMNKKENPAA